MRGKGADLATVTAATRITPAYAGKSSHEAGHPVRLQDHPRVCGEKFLGTKTWTTRQGSPPRMRGKASSPSRWILGTRITPAYAGKRKRWGGTSLRTWDHPRVCGEKKLFGSSSSLGMGSPPRMRGKAGTSDTTTIGVGITPAYAGKSIRPKEDLDND